MGFRVQGSGFGVWGSGFGVQGLGFRVWGPGFGVQGLGFRVWGSWFGVQGLGWEDYSYLLLCQIVLGLRQSRLQPRALLVGQLQCGDGL